MYLSEGGLIVIIIGAIVIFLVGIRTGATLERRFGDD